MRVYRLFLKRAIDLIVSFVGLVILSPIFLLIIIAIKFDSPGPIFFRQKRVCAHKKHFNILKFRTMRIDTPHDMPTHMLKNPEKWITRTGRVLRRTSLDELPQIINILAGHMSIVGPRPALWNQFDLIEERDRYTRDDITVNDLNPGLTGWAQIHGRDEIEVVEKAMLDGVYLNKFGFLTDLRCFFGTIGKVLRHEGVVEGGTGVIQNGAEGDKNEMSVKK